MIDVQDVYEDLCRLLDTDETLLERMAQALPVTHEETRIVCFELVRFLVWKSLYPNKLIAPTEEVDEVWHEFILHTELYREFCKTHFGTFIDHRPLSDSRV
ncbi:MAG: hypothetical protein V4437_02530 [Patescibacteria group bacterium]